ncbi:MAG: S-layer homology domain-containing protein [Oscillospiraceae bacterium]|nr:S-layer homology domain-containing protein [Oscillospiraceae bacterium]
MKRFLSLLLALVMALSLCTAAFATRVTPPVYGDVAKGSWYESYVNQMVAAGLMNGVGDSEFDPNGTLSRAMFVTILYRAAGKPATGKPAAFADVAKGSWYADGVDWAANGGVVNGVTATAFAPSNSLTREQMVTILYRRSGAEKADAAALDAFPDKGDVSSYAVDAFAWAVKNNVIGGKNGKLEPKGTTTRAEACAVLARYLETIAPTREDLEKAVAATAWAYFAKVGKLQYCGASMAALDKFYTGDYRVTSASAPEYGTSDTTIYSVCSDYAHQVYMNALGYGLFGSPDYLDASTDSHWSLSADDGTAVMRYAQDDYESSDAKQRGVTRDTFLTMEQAQDFFRNWKDTMRPGDIVVVGKDAGNHAMVYIGDGFLIDCRGKSYNMTAGSEVVESGGGVIYIYDVARVLVTGDDPNWKDTYKLGNVRWCVVTRPLDAICEKTGGVSTAADKPKNGFYIIPAATLEREKNPLLDIDRTVNITPYGTAYTGEELTYTVKLTNRSDDAQYRGFAFDATDFEDLVVTEKIPAGTEFVAGSAADGTFENGMLTWKVNIAAGESETLSYKVKVTASQGETIVSTGGFVGDIPSNTIKNAVGGKKLSAAAQDGLKKLAATPVAQWRETYNISANATDLDFAERIYAKGAGLQLDLPTVEELLTGLFKYGSETRGSLSIRYSHIGKTKTQKMFTHKHTLTGDAELWSKMIVPNYVGGYRTLFDNNVDQINEFHAKYLEPGDILIFADVNENGKPTDVRVAVAAGDGILLTNTTGYALDAIDGVIAEEILWRSFVSDIFMVLRPSLAVEDVNVPYSGTEPTYGEEPVPEERKFTPLSEENKAKFAALATASDPGWSGRNYAFAENVYKLVGLDISPVTQSKGLVTIAAWVFRDLGKNEQTGAKKQYIPFYTLPEGSEAVCKMLLAGYRGGPFMAPATDMLAQPTAAMLEIGDILLLCSAEARDYWIGVYLGDGKMIISHYNAGVTETNYVMHDFSGEQGEAAYAKLLHENTDTGNPWEYYFVLRPAQGYADINTGKLN